MIRETRGNLIEADAEALVNTVNTVGVMGKGIALQFKRAFPEAYEEYRRACERGEVQPGRMHVVDLGELARPRYVINFPTKRHWRAKSKLGDVDAGLDALVDEVRRRGIRSVAVPPLGCGNGGLRWRDVRPRIEAAFAALPAIDILLFPPGETPAPEAMPDRTKRPKMTAGRAALLGVMSRYQVPGYEYRLSLLETQKLAYFLQGAGEPLKLVFGQGTYGPYADNLRHVLQRIEGHFVVGFGDGRNQPDTPLELRPDAVAEADELLRDHSATRDRLRRVAELIEGFETPFGMELLSSVHWCAKQVESTDAPAILAGIRSWSERKSRLFRPDHVDTAIGQLRQCGWL